jgi:hypothetical protein
MWSDDDDDNRCAGLAQLVPALLRGDPPLTEEGWPSSWMLATSRGEPAGR